MLNLFKKKRRIRKYNINYGKSPSPRKSFSRIPKFKKKDKSSASLPLVRKQTKRIAKILVLIVIIAALTYVFFFSPYFLIKEVVVTNESIENQVMSEKIKQSASNVLGKNLIFVNKDGLETQILEVFSELQEIKIGKDYPHKIEIEFSEYPLIANVINETSTLRKTFIINSIGFVIKEDYEDPSLPYIKIQSDEAVNPSNAIIDSTKLNQILEVKKYFEDKFGMGVKEIIYKPTPREIHVLTDRDFYIWLDFQESTEDQFKKLKKALVKLDIYTENFEYIDLRISGTNGDKIIYKRVQ